MSHDDRLVLIENSQKWRVALVNPGEARLNSITESREIFTIGHSNLAANHLITSLHSYQIETLVDVRTSPYSQYAPQFNRENLARELGTEDIEYMFAGESLGGRPTDPTCYKNGQLPPPKSDYLKLVDYMVVATKPWYLEGIERLIEMAGEHRVAVMCSEEDPYRCHRHHLIAKSLLQRGISVAHIRKTGELQSAVMKEDDADREPQPKQAVLL